jgi:selenide,water dikinase
MAAAIASMTSLNRAASEAMRRHDVHACTDVTGYGLVGHLREMAAASGLSARIDGDAVPRLPGVEALVDAGHVPGGTLRNLEDVEDAVDWGDTDAPSRTLLADAQTSGGLLVALAREDAEALVAELRGTVTDDEAGATVPAAPAIIGVLEEGSPGSIRVVG